MKRTLSLILAAITVFTSSIAFAFSVSADYPTSEVMCGYENLVLTYTHNSNRDDMGRFSPDDLMPYVAYYDKNGKMTDFFFDSYLFLPCMSYGVSGARIHYDETNPTKAVDWEFYVKDTFTAGANVDALDVAFARAKKELGDPDRKAGVVLSILYPAANQTDFGSLGGKNLDFRNLDDRKYAIRWIIDEQLKLYNERGYENLELIGFYWLEEYLVTYGNPTQNKELYKYAAEYLHSLGLKFIWIPWYRANGYKQWQELGFDAVCMQPNMFWQTIATNNRVADTAKECKLYGMGVEMEIDGRALYNAECYNRYLDYLEECMLEGAMDTIKMYYQDANQGVFYQACHSSDDRARSVYDLTYKYAKGTLKKSDIDGVRAPEFKLPEGVTWRSNGKKYVATPAYYDGNGSSYQDNDGKELTDGIIGTSELGTEWHGFHKSILDADGRMSVTVDLGAIYKDLTHFVAHFSHIQNYGVDDPANIKIEISRDGKNFTTLSEPELLFRDMSAYVMVESKPITAQYVKFSFTNSAANFVFCSEVLVGAAQEQNKDDESTPPSESSEPESDKSDIIEGSEPNDSVESTEPSESVSYDSADQESNADNENEKSDSTEDSDDSTWYIWCIAGIILIVIGVSIFVFASKKPKKQ